MRQRDFKTLGVALIIMAFICISGGFIVGYLNDTNFVNPSAILGKDDSSGITVSTYEDGGADGLSSSADSNGNVENNSGIIQLQLMKKNQLLLIMEVVIIQQHLIQIMMKIVLQHSLVLQHKLMHKRMMH